MHPRGSQLASAQIEAVYAAALQKCETYMAFLLVDTRNTDAATFMSTWYTNTNIENLFSDHAAVYYPRLQVPDPLDSYNMRPVAPSGTVGRLIQPRQPRHMEGAGSNRNEPDERHRRRQPDHEPRDQPE